MNRTQAYVGAFGCLILAQGMETRAGTIAMMVLWALHILAYYFTPYKEERR